MEEVGDLDRALEKTGEKVGLGGALKLERGVTIGRTNRPTFFDRVSSSQSDGHQIVMALVKRLFVSRSIGETRLSALMWGTILRTSVYLKT